MCDMAFARTTALSIAITGDTPPSEFRIFAAGANETVKGTFVFDEAAAQSVMAEYEAHGIDLPLDYDHAMLGGGNDPALSGKAAGWFGLEVRNGELWAVNVRWTEPAAAALSRKEWRFMSPAFQADEKGHVRSLLNVAITNLPATRRLEPLMAASVTALGVNAMDPEIAKKALDLIANGDADGALALLKDVLAAAAGGGGGETEAPAEESAPEEMAETPAVEDPKEDKPEEVAAALSALQVLSGKGLVASVSDIRLWRASHLELEEGRQKLAQERATLEAAERRKGCVDLVALGGMAPSMVWSDAKCSAPKKYLAEMPIADFRDFVSDAVKSKGGKVLASKAQPPIQPGVQADGSRDFQTPHGTVTLSASELRVCEETKCNPKEYAANKAAMAAPRGGR